MQAFPPFFTPQAKSHLLLLFSSTLVVCLELLEVADCFPEFSGTLLGFDDYVNMVLEDVTELYV